jgi:hypothetical protein
MKFLQLSLLCLGFLSAAPLVWKPQEDSPPPQITSQNQVQLSLPWQSLKGWRFYWDAQGQFGFDRADRIKVHFRAEDPDKAGIAILYFESGKGWYRFPAVKLSRDTVLYFERSKASEEGEVAGWGAVKRVRLGFMPSELCQNTKVELVDLSPYAAWSPADLGRVAQWNSYAQVRDTLAARMQSSVDTLALQKRLLAVDSVFLNLQNPKLSAEEMRLEIHRGRSLISEALALSLPKASQMDKAFWLSPSQWGESTPAEREFVAEQLHQRNVRALFLRTPLRGGTEDRAQARLWARVLAKHQVPIWLWVQIPPVQPCDGKNQQDLEREIKLLVAEFQGASLLLDGWRSGTEEASAEGGLACRQQYLAQGGDLSQTENWQRFRLDRMADALGSLRKSIKSPLGLSVYSYPNVAKSSVLEEWGAWAHKGLVDLIVTQTFSQDVEEFEHKVALQKAEVPKGFPLWTGLVAGNGDLRADLAVVSQQWLYLNAIGLQGAAFAELHPDVFRKVLPLLPK